MESVASSIGSSAPTGSSARSSPSASPSLKITSASQASPSVYDVSSASSTAAAAAAAHSRLIAGYPRLTGFYPNTTYPPAPQPPTSGSSTNSTTDCQTSSLYSSNPASSFYPSLGSAYDLDKGATNTWTGLGSQSTATSTYPTYDPAAHSFYTPYGNCYGAIDSAARRKNATRETTNTLKAWLYEHRKNPYPTKGEKIMLAIITKMTLTQVSTWFANARRRLKKENKMTWEPKNKTSDSRDHDDKDSCKSADDDDDGTDSIDVKHNNVDNTRISMTSSLGVVGSNGQQRLGHVKDDKKPIGHLGHSELVSSQQQHHIPSHQQHSHSHFGGFGHHHENLDAFDGQRPKIWSLAQTATAADAAAAASLAAGRFYPDWYASTFPSTAATAPSSASQELLGQFTDSYNASASAQHPHHHHYHHHHSQHQQQYHTFGQTQQSHTGLPPPPPPNTHSQPSPAVQSTQPGAPGSFYKTPSIPAWQTPETSAHVRAAAAAAAAVSFPSLNSNSLKIHV